MIRRLFYIFIFLFFTGGGAAAHYRFDQWTADNGLPQNSVTAVAQTSDGYLWLTTNDGLVRFDGVRFTVFNKGNSPDLPSNRLGKMLADGNDLWFLTEEENPVRFHDGKFRTFTTADGLASDTASFVTKGPRGNILVYAREGVFRFENDAFSPVQKFTDTDYYLTYPYYAPSGAVWNLTREKLIRNRSGETTEYKLPPGLTNFLANTDLSKFRSKILETVKGELWFTIGFYVYKLENGEIVRISKEEQSSFDANVISDKNGAVWIGTSNGLSVLKDGKFTDYRKSKRILVQSLLEDRDGRLWVGSVNHGLFLFQNGEFHETQEKFNFSLVKADGLSSVFDIHQDKNGVLWFASNTGLYNYDGEKLDRLTTADGLPSDDVKVIHESADGETLWIGTYGGLAELRGGKINALTEQSGLTGNHIRSLFEDESGTLWIGTYDSGLSRFAAGKFTNYKKENGLFSDGVFQILPDDRGNFWMSSNQGIYRVSRIELEEFAEGHRRTIISIAYGKSDGMLSTEANGGGQPAGIKMRDGQLWFPTQNGVAIINPASVKTNPLPPPVVIEDARLDNETVGKLSKQIEILPGQGNLEIDYSGLSFIKPEQIRFRYRLEGLDGNWTEAGTRRTAFFPNLGPGAYTFRVIAANSDNVWNEEGATLKIVVKPPFYRTWIFLLSCVAAILLVTYALYRRRLFNLERDRRTQEEFSRRLINAHESERRRIAAELHDSIGQSLAMIKNRVVQSAETVTDENIRRQLNLITAQTTQTIGEVREISYNLRPYLLENLGLTKAVRSLLNKVAETDQVKIQIELDEVDDLFEPEAEMSIYRIIQENLTNILKHSEATEVQVFLKKSDRNLTILISDDGKGFDPKAAQTKVYDKGGFGLLGISERVKMLGGTQEIESEIGGGTNVLIKIPWSER